MAIMEYFTPTHVYFGEGAADKAGEVLKEQGASKVLVHFGGGSVKRSGLLDRVEARLDEAGIAYDVVYAEEPEGAELASEYNITSAPTLIVQKDGKADLYGNVSNIRGFIHNIQ